MLERVKTPARLGGHESFQTAGGALTLRLGAKLADESHARREWLAGDDLARRFAPPIDNAARREAKGLVALARERAKPTGDLGSDHPLDRAAQRAILERGRATFGLEMEAGEPADQMALHRHRPVAIDAAKNWACALIQAAQKRAGAPIDEPLHQGLMERVGEAVLKIPRPALPGSRMGEPVRTIGDIGKSPHPGEPGRQSVDIAVAPIEARELRLHPVLRHPPVALGEVLEHRPDESRVLILCRLAKVGRLA